MVTRVARATTIFTLIALTTGCDLVTGPEDEYEAAQAAAESWISAHPTAWSLSIETRSSIQRASYSKPCRENPVGGFVVLQAVSNGIDLLLHLRCPIDSGATISDLNAAFSHLTIDALPHGIHSDNWEFDAMPPSSSIFQGVLLTHPRAGRLQVTVNASLYAIYGQSTRKTCEPMMDGPMAEGCYLLREHRIPLNLEAIFLFNPSVLD